MSNFWHALTAGFHRVVVAMSHFATHVGGASTPAVVAALVVLAVGCLSYCGVVVFSHPDHWLEDVMRPYRLISERTEEIPNKVELRAIRPTLRRAGEYLMSLVEARGKRPALEKMIARAGLPIGAGEFLLAATVGLVVLCLLGGLVAAIPGALAGLVLGVFAPFGLLQLRAERRQRAFNGQLPDLLKIIASSLRGGFSLLQSLVSVVDQCSDPIQHELKIAMVRISLGEPIEEALEDVANRTGSEDFRWAVMAIRIQREVGGNLSIILDTVATTMLERERIRGEVRTLTAEGRASAIILAVLPLALGGFIYIANRPYMSLLFHSFSGQMAIMFGIGLEIFGTLWMRRTIQIEV